MSKHIHKWIDVWKEPTYPNVSGTLSRNPDDSPDSFTYIQHQICSRCGEPQEVQMPSKIVRKP